MTATATASAGTDLAWKQRYDRDGFLNFGRILSPQELEALSQRVDAICAGNSLVPAGNIKYYEHLEGTDPSSMISSVWQVLGSHQFDEVVMRVCEHPRIASLVTVLLGVPGQLLTSQIITKPAGHGEQIPWHQDSSYWGPRRVVTCWLAIDDATPENGCMRMIPGSHLAGQLEFHPKRYPSIRAELLEAIRVDESRQVHVPVPAGCASFHTHYTLHASSRNTTARRRRAIAVTFGA